MSKISRNARSSIGSDASTESEDLAGILQALRIVPKTNELFCGIDIPARAAMKVRWFGPTKIDYVVQFRIPGRSLPIIEFPVQKTTSTKTVAVLRRGDNDALVASVSGWSEVFSCSYEYLLDNREWTGKVFDVCDAVGHNLLPDNFRDKGEAGRYNACHAEKQLLAYVFDNHCSSVDLHISTEPCVDCLSFIDCFQEAEGIEINICVNGKRGRVSRL